MKIKVLVLMLIFLSTLLYSQSVIWEETFETNPGNWTLDQNWNISDGILSLYYSPTVEPYDLSAISPVISLPTGAYEFIATHYFQEYSAVDEIGEISILYDGQEDILWSWELTQGNWGTNGGTDTGCPISSTATKV